MLNPRPSRWTRASRSHHLVESPVFADTVKDSPSVAESEAVKLCGEPSCTQNRHLPTVMFVEQL
ncbi:hypothetical protein [Streptomyces sp. NPDC048665]|uniref:hypothetical protein n=1 Tax=unclassified Streptomyces TaxID=2593676 RepID=UPI00342A6A1D